MASTWRRLQEALGLEEKFQPELSLPQSASAAQSAGGEVTTRQRDGSAQVLRCLKAWYDLPSDVLLVALNLMDRFLSRMRARPKHLSCIAISAFHLSVRYYRGGGGGGGADGGVGGVEVPTPAELAALSQAKCSAGDVQRMCAIICDKLGCDASAACTLPVTPATLLRCMLAVLEAEFSTLASSQQQQPSPPQFQQPALQPLLTQLESVLCCSEAASARSSELALALLADAAPAPLVAALRRFCRVDEQSFGATRSLVARLLEQYNGGAGSTPRPYRQRLLWRLSRRTLGQLRPSHRLRSVLPTIEESRDASIGAVSASSGGSKARRRRRHRRRASRQKKRSASLPPTAA